MMFSILIIPIYNVVTQSFTAGATRPIDRLKSNNFQMAFEST